MRGEMYSCIGYIQTVIRAIGTFPFQEVFLAIKIQALNLSAFAVVSGKDFFVRNVLIHELSCRINLTFSSICFIGNAPNVHILSECHLIACPQRQGLLIRQHLHYMLGMVESLVTGTYPVEVQSFDLRIEIFFPTLASGWEGIYGQRDARKNLWEAEQRIKTFIDGP